MYGKFLLHFKFNVFTVIIFKYFVTYLKYFLYLIKLLDK